MIQVIHAQDLLKALEEVEVEDQQHTIATFKGTTISIGHSVETRKKGALEISTVNRFWNTREEQTQNFAADKWKMEFSIYLN